MHQDGLNQILQNKEFHNSHLSPNTVREVKIRARLAGQTAGRGEIGNVNSGQQVA